CRSAWRATRRAGAAARRTVFSLSIRTGALSLRAVRSGAGRFPTQTTQRREPGRACVAQRAAMVVPLRDRCELGPEQVRLRFAYLRRGASAERFADPLGGGL